jgi:hypothetical protein
MYNNHCHRVKPPLQLINIIIIIIILLFLISHPPPWNIPILLPNFLDTPLGKMQSLIFREDIYSRSYGSRIADFPSSKITHADYFPCGDVAT